MKERNGDIVTTARITVSPEKRREFRLTITALLDLIRNENGCRSYRFYDEVEDQNSFTLISEWETRDAWDHHLASDNFAVLIGSLRLLSDRPDVYFKVLSHMPRAEALTRARCEPAMATHSPNLR